MTPDDASRRKAAERREAQALLRYHEAQSLGWADAEDDRPDRALAPHVVVPALAPTPGPIDWAAMEDDLDAVPIIAEGAPRPATQVQDAPPEPAELCAQLLDGQRRLGNRIKAERMKARRALREQEERLFRGPPGPERERSLRAASPRERDRWHKLMAQLREIDARLAAQQAGAAAMWTTLLPVVRAVLAGEVAGWRYKRGRIVDPKGRDLPFDQVLAGKPIDEISVGRLGEVEVRW